MRTRPYGKKEPQRQSQSERSIEKRTNKETQIIKEEIRRKKQVQNSAKRTGIRR